MLNIQSYKLIISRKLFFVSLLLFISFTICVLQNIKDFFTAKNEMLIIARYNAEMRSTQLTTYLNMLSALHEKKNKRVNNIFYLSGTSNTKLYRVLSPYNGRLQKNNNYLELLNYLSSTISIASPHKKTLTDYFLLSVKDNFLAWHSSDQSDIAKVMTDDNARMLIKSLRILSYNTTEKHNIEFIKKKNVFWVPLHDEIISGKHVVYSISPVVVNNQVTHIIGIRFQGIDIPCFFIKQKKKHDGIFIISMDRKTAFGLGDNIYTANDKTAISAILQSPIWKLNKTEKMQFHLVWPYIYTSANIKEPLWSIVIAFSIGDILTMLIKQHDISFTLSGFILSLMWIGAYYCASSSKEDNINLHFDEHNKSFFLAGVTHEIRTPLHGALGNLELLRNEVNSPSAVARINVINNTMSSLMVLTDSILNKAEIEANEFSLVHKPYDLIILLEQCLQTWSPLISRKKISLYFLPDDILDLHFSGDSQRLSQIVLNLLSNANKFTTHGAIILQTSCTVNSRGQRRLQISVSDTGCGIPEDKQKVIFRPFVQNVAEHPQYTEGTGLGLALCQQLAKRMEGEIFLESEIDVGSRFILDIPLEAISVHPNLPDARQAEIHVALYCSSRLWEASLIRILSHWGVKVTPQDIHALPSIHQVDKTVLIASTELPPLFSLTSTGSPVILLTPDGSLAPETSGNLTRLTAFSMAALKECLQQQITRQGRISEREMIADSSILLTPKLLVVDDNPVNLALIHQQLHTIGYCNIDRAGSGEEALAQLQTSHYALIITDFYMPKLGGEDLVLWLRLHGLKTPVIATSAATVNSQRFDAILLKPVSLEQLKTTINRFLPHSETAQAYPAGLLFIDAHGIFAREWPAECERIRIAIVQGDRQDFCRLMHRLKGSLLTLGWHEHTEFIDAICRDLPTLSQKTWDNCWLILSVSLEHMIKYID